MLSDAIARVVLGLLALNEQMLSQWIVVTNASEDGSLGTEVAQGGAQFFEGIAHLVPTLVLMIRHLLPLTLLGMGPS